MSSLTPKRSLGQHWLHDVGALEAMAEAAEIIKGDDILEVGPGLGTLTEILLGRGTNVTAVEFDKELAEDLNARFRHSGRDPEFRKKNKDRIISQAENDNKVSPCNRVTPCKGKLQVVNEDILRFDLTKMPKNYKVCANIPYYLTSNLIRTLLESPNPPSVMALLIQKEVAERIVAEPGQMSILSVSVQFYAEATLKEVVPAELFTPPPKVDSQIIQIKRREAPLFPDIDSKKFFQLVKAGFSEKRKQLRSSLSGGLHISKAEADELLKKANIPPTARAQELYLDQWHQISSVL